MSYPNYEKKADVTKLYPGFITVDDALDIANKDDAELAKKHQLEHNNQYRTAAAMAIGAGDVAVKAEGAYWWDVDGVKHLDFIGSVGPALLGLNNPFVVDAVKKYLDKHLVTMDPLMIHQTTGAFSYNMSLIVPYLPRTVICCGGAEANETLLKMLKLASYRNKKGKNRMLTTINAFHGKTVATVNLGGKAKWRQWQGPDLEGYCHVPYGDIAAAEEELAKGDIIAFLAEPIQGEGGVNVPPDNYFPEIKKLCKKYDAYFCLDEVQAGSCRTGYLWAHQYYETLGMDARPDALSFAKAMSDSLVPTGGVLASEELYMAAYGNDETAFFHTATYQDNQISGITALACLQFMMEADVPGTIRANAPYFWEGLKKVQAKYPNVIKQVRGRGYMIGLEYGQNKAGEYYTVPVCMHMSIDGKVCTMFTINNDAVCRIYPNYWATKEDFDWAIDALDKACASALKELGE